MGRVLLILLVLGAVVSLSCGANPQEQAGQSKQAAPGATQLTPDQQIDGKEYFAYETLTEDLLKLANEEYGRVEPDYSNPDNDIGTPPFQFVKKVECDVVRVDPKIEALIKKSSETASYHAVYVLQDARKDLYSFTLTSTVPDKSVVRLQQYGPLTNENPDIVDRPINQRRFTDFPIDFHTGRPLEAKDGRCIYLPYPFPADQEFWLFGTDLYAAPLQGLYRNDRFKNLDELIALIVEAVKQQETSVIP